MMKFFIYSFFIYFLSFTCTYAQSKDAVQSQHKFKYLTVDKGLSNNNVRSICQDSKGFIWLATQNGLNKYNGQSIVSYRHNQNDTNTISSNELTKVFLDSKNNLWLASAKGLDLYNADFNNFTRFKHKDIDWPLGQIFDITEDRNENLWFGGVSGLYSYNLNTSKIQYFSNRENNLQGIPPNVIYRLMVDKNNKVWISVQNDGLCVYDQKDSTLTCFQNNPDDPSTISGNRIEIIYEDTKGTIWAGTMNNGINQYLPESNSFIRSIPDPNDSFSTRVRAIFEDLKGNLFVGTRSGLYIKDHNTTKFLLYANEAHNFSKISQNSITTSYIDKTGTLWLGTFSGGANFTNLNRKEFVHYFGGKNDNQFLSGANVYSVTEDSKGHLWLGGDHGLSVLDRTTYTFKYHFNDPQNPNSLSYNDIKALESDKFGNLWIGTNRGGLNYYNVKTDKFESYTHDPSDSNSIAGNKVYGLLNDKDNNLWILVTQENNYQIMSIDILPNGSDKFIHLKEKAYFGIDQDKNGDILIGGANGFWIFSKQDSIFNFIANEVLIDNVNVIKKDSKGNIWVGSGKGLVRYNPIDKSFVSFSEANGYPIFQVFGVLEDGAKNLWVSTNLGLVKMINIVEDVKAPEFRVFDSDDGLQSKQFNSNAYYKCKSGEMVFGGINGFNTFFPDKIIENKVAVDVIITDLKLFNKTVPIGEKVSGRVILEKSISITDKIWLGPKDNVFSLEFASLQNANPDKDIFRFKLEGLDKDWGYRKAGNNIVTYTNLTPGEYTFIVAAANIDGIWNDEPVKLKIVVVPPFWKTWWFRLIASLVIVSIVLAIYYYRLRSIRYQNRVLEETVEKRTLEISDKNEEIVSQNEELELHRNNLESLVKDRTLKLEKALTRARESEKLKTAFLANMSHEIRTPMNAIIGFSSLMNDNTLSDEERASFIQIIHSNSKGLLNIIDEILDLSLLESNQLKLKKEIFDLNLLLEHLYSYYYLNNNNSRIEIRKKNTLQDQNLKLDSDSIRIKQILTNLMDNACKFTTQGYVEIGTYMDKDDLCIYVEDTGRGIPSKELDNIFKQFTKVEDQDAEWTQGIGLGLAISQKITEALGAEIKVKSTREKGSTFTFSIPITNVITSDEIVVPEIPKLTPNSWQGKTILIAEDVEANFLYLKNILKKTKTNIIRAKNGEEALKLALEHSGIDLILMDIKMPIMNGYEVAKKIKKHNPNQIIVAQTAYARPEEKIDFYDENFDEYLSKPIDPVNLLMILEQFL